MKTVHRYTFRSLNGGIPPFDIEIPHYESEYSATLKALEYLGYGFGRNGEPTPVRQITEKESYDMFHKYLEEKYGKRLIFLGEDWGPLVEIMQDLFEIQYETFYDSWYEEHILAKGIEVVQDWEY